jgi:hypothetical protein
LLVEYLPRFDPDFVGGLLSINSVRKLTDGQFVFVKIHAGGTIVAKGGVNVLEALIYVRQ